MEKSLKPAYWEQALEELSRADPVMAEVIQKVGRGKFLQSRGRPFETLLRSIVGQQISTKAAASIWQRFVKACPELTPEKISRKHRKTLRSTGLSERKIDYVLDVCRFFIAEETRAKKIEDLPDEDVIRELVSIKGVGEWTAHMFLIFTLLRPNVLPLADLGLIRAIKTLYFEENEFESLDLPERKARIDKITKNWEPWRTVATWYLWASLENGGDQY